MAGYSGTPLAKKLGIKPGHHLLTLRTPAGFDIPDLPGDLARSTSTRGSRPIDVAVLFAKNRAALESDFARIEPRLTEAGGLWVAWPKKASGVKTDITEAVVRAHGLGSGLVDNKICAIDDTWSGLRFVRRVTDRKKASETRKDTQ